jgi:hypothetical protein
MVNVEKVEKKLSQLMHHLFVRYCLATDPNQQWQKYLSADAIRACVSDMSAVFPHTTEGGLAEELLQQTQHSYGFVDFCSFFERLMESEFGESSEPPSAFSQFVATAVDKLFVLFVIYKPVKPAYQKRVQLKRNIIQEQRGQKPRRMVWVADEHARARDDILALCASSTGTNRYYQQAASALPNNQAILCSFDMYKQAKDSENRESKTFTRNFSRSKSTSRLLSEEEFSNPLGVPASKQHTRAHKPHRPATHKAGSEIPWEAGTIQDDLLILKHACLDADLRTKIQKMQEYLRKKELRPHHRVVVDFVDTNDLLFQSRQVAKAIRPSSSPGSKVMRRKKHQKLLGRGRASRLGLQDTFSAPVPERSAGVV